MGPKYSWEKNDDNDNKAFTYITELRYRSMDSRIQI